MNRLTSEAGPFGTTVTVSYDSLGRLTNASFSGHTWTYQYDALSRITNILAPEGIYRLGYHEQGLRKTSVQYPNSVTASMTYDSLIRMTNLAYSVGASNLLSIRYGYDNGDRRSSEVWGDGRSLTYVYDRAHQLLDSVSTSRASDNASYRYDKAGNPLRRSEMGFGVTNNFNNLNQIVAGIWTGGAITVSGAVNYNAGTVTVNGVTANRFGMFYEKTNVSLSVGTNLITAVYHGPGFTNHPNVVTAMTQVVVGQAAYTHDPNGNLTADANFLYRYDALNQLTNVVTKLGATNLLANRYDGLGRRIQATTGGTNIVRYVYLPGTFLVLATLDGANNLLETFTHGPDLSGTLGGAGGIGGILSQTKHQGPTTTHFLHPDSMGNVILTTDESGAVSSTYRYTPFGRPYAKTGPFTSRFTFSSKEFDGATGLGYWGYRFYSPGLGRWVNRDPIGEDGGVNLYMSFYNNSINYLDHLGLRVDTWKVKKCRINIFVTHASRAPDSIDNESCSATALTKCGENTARRLPTTIGNPLPTQGSTKPLPERKGPVQARDVFRTPGGGFISYEEAVHEIDQHFTEGIKHAEDVICKDTKECCRKVTVEVVCKRLNFWDRQSLHGRCGKKEVIRCR